MPEMPASAQKTRLPPLYKKRVKQAVLVYLLLMLGLGGWLLKNRAETEQAWFAAMPHVNGPILDLAEAPPAEQAPAETAAQEPAATPAPAAQPPDQPAATAPETAPPATTEAPSAAPADAPPAVAAPAAPVEQQPLAPPVATKPVIALMMTDMGLMSDATSRALKILPPAAGIAVSPYSPALADWLKQSAETGHETFILLPMEPVAYPKDDPGPLSLLSRQSRRENMAALAALLQKAPDVTGAVNFMGSRFLADTENMKPVFEELKKRGMIFIEDADSIAPRAARTANSTGISYLASDITLRVPMTAADIRRKLAEAEETAQRRGYAVVVAEPYPAVLEALPAWFQTLKERGIDIAPPSKARR